MKITNINYMNDICTFEFIDGKISNIAKGLDKFADIDVDGSSVSIGWIDSHVHIAPNLKGFTAKSDEVGIKKGVTTIVDAGSCGWNNFNILEKHSQEIETDLFYLVNLSRDGLARLDELTDSSLFNKEKTINVLKENKKALGIKVRLSKSVHGNNYEAAHKLASEITSKLNVPLVAHIGNGPPSLKEIIDNSPKKTILCHIFHSKINGINHEIKKLKMIKNFTKNGGAIDIAHGSDSFSMEIGKFAIKNNLKPDIISTDVYAKNINGCVQDLQLTMSKLLECGMSEEEVIDAVTVNVIERLSIPIDSKIKIGYRNSLTFYKLIDQKTKTMDSTGKVYEINKLLVPTGIWHRNNYKKVKNNEEDN